MIPSSVLWLSKPDFRFRHSFLSALDEMKSEADRRSWLYVDPDRRENLTTANFEAYVSRLNALKTAPPIGFVPDTSFWGILDNEVVGRISLRHELNDQLSMVGGHIGYITRPSYRNRGVAKELLAQTVRLARAQKIGQLLLTCDENNTGSIKTIESQGGVELKRITVDPPNSLSAKKIHFQIDSNRIKTTPWIKSVVFDLDGTLVDSRLNFAELRSQLGLSPETPILEALAHLNENERLLAMKTVSDFERAGAEASSLYPGARETLATLKAHSVAVGLFTRNSRPTAEWTLKRHDLRVDAVFAREDGPPKPSPMGLWTLADGFQSKLSEMLFVGDYTYDLEAGLAANVPTCLFAPEPSTVSFPIDSAFHQFSNFSAFKDWLRPQLKGINEAKT